MVNLHQWRYSAGYIHYHLPHLTPLFPIGRFQKTVIGDYTQKSSNLSYVHSVSIGYVDTNVQ